MALVRPPRVNPLPRTHIRLVDRGEGLPPRLQLRLDAWVTASPESQFKTYGPLAAYLHIKFPPDYFLIKPQAWLSTVADAPEAAQPEAAQGDQPAEEAQGEDPETQRELGHRRFDSTGTAVKKDWSYPDFTICQYFGADNDGNSAGDVIRVVYEISTGDTYVAQFEATRNTGRYMDKVTEERYDGYLLGVAQAGNKVYLFRAENNGVPYALYPGVWMGLDDDRFVQELNNIRNEAYRNDGRLAQR